MSIIAFRTGEDKGQFHISREMSDPEIAQLNAISDNWDFDGGFESDGSLWINSPMEPALIARFASALEAMPA